MFIEFQVENFRSIKERQTFTMVADHYPEHQQENTFQPAVQGGFPRLLKTAVVYGPNAAGKTNLLKAMKFMKDFVVGSARSTPTEYPYCPFKLSESSRRRPSEFQMTFLQDGARYEYGFAMGPEYIVREWLVEYSHSGTRTRGRTMFDRTWDRPKKRFTWKFGAFLKGQRQLWSEATRPDALFLSTAIQLNSSQLKPVFEWFHQRLIPIVGDTKLNESLTLRLLDLPDGKRYVLPFLQEADLGIADLEVRREPIPSGGLFLGQDPILRTDEGRAPEVVKVTFSHVSDNPKAHVPIDYSDESSGTKILFKTAGAWLHALSRGEVLVFDEIDTNLHPTFLRFLLRKFHSREGNPKNAQLICSTHNTSLLDQKLFRRDQVWFVEKQKNGSSKLYPLSDFSPRNDEALEKSYERGRYGALPILPESGP